MKKKKFNVAVLVVVTLILVYAIVYLLLGNPIVLYHNLELKNSLKSIESDTVHLNEVVPFEWDTLYTFDAYTSQDYIEDIIGFESSDIKVNNVNEGLVHLLFVHEDHVVSSVLGYPNKLGYNIDFLSDGDMKISFDEEAIFSVSKTKGLTTLTSVK